ncbi:NAD(P)-binding domain-containing protein [Methyloprofundus sp.]|uniref:NAD(P)-binding domain-containing protein n=1 Tax=Methyloprofundus sp. TaxID=2020875 RepID=UPI003D151A7F
MSLIKRTQLLIIGAGPYGLAAARLAKIRELDYLVSGSCMSFWKQHMPPGMNLRTTCDWGESSELEHFLQQRQLTFEQISPVPREFFIDFVETTAKSEQLNWTLGQVAQVNYEQDIYKCVMDNGDVICAQNILVATGYYDYRFIPTELAAIFPEEQRIHTADCADLSKFSNQRCLIVGGRQSAFETAALLASHAESVELVYRHARPEFVRSDWTWTDEHMQRTRTQPGWWRKYPAEEKQVINQRFWHDGRLQLEDSLEQSVTHKKISHNPDTTIVGCVPQADGSLQVSLSGDRTIFVDQVICATGYRPDVQKIPFIADGNILNKMEIKNSLPELSDALESNIPGLYFTGIHGVNDFGPFLFFVAGSTAAAEIVINSIESQINAK